MKTANLVGLGALALAAYLLYKNMAKEKPKAKEAKAPEQEASMAGYGYATGVPQDKRVTVQDLSYRPGLNTSWRLRVQKARRRPKVKAPIYINPLNAIPNVYDRGVGAEVVGMSQVIREPYMNADGEQMYASFGGLCSKDLQRACRCVVDKPEQYRLEIPKLP